MPNPNAVNNAGHENAYKRAGDVSPTGHRPAPLSDSAGSAYSYSAQSSSEGRPYLHAGSVKRDYREIHASSSGSGYEADCSENDDSPYMENATDNNSHVEILFSSESEQNLKRRSQDCYLSHCANAFVAKHDAWTPEEWKRLRDVLKESLEAYRSKQKEAHRNPSVQDANTTSMARSNIGRQNQVEQETYNWVRNTTSSLSPSQEMRGADTSQSTPELEQLELTHASLALKNHLINAITTKLNSPKSKNTKKVSSMPSKAQPTAATTCSASTPTENAIQKLKGALESATYKICDDAVIEKYHQAFSKQEWEALCKSYDLLLSWSELQAELKLQTPQDPSAAAIQERHLKLLLYEFKHPTRSSQQADDKWLKWLGWSWDPQLSQAETKQPESKMGLLQKIGHTLYRAATAPPRYVARLFTRTLLPFLPFKATKKVCIRHAYHEFEDTGFNFMRAFLEMRRVIPARNNETNQYDTLSPVQCLSTQKAHTQLLALLAAKARSQTLYKKLNGQALGFADISLVNFLSEMLREGAFAKLQGAQINSLGQDSAWSLALQDLFRWDPKTKVFSLAKAPDMETFYHLRDSVDKALQDELTIRGSIEFCRACRDACTAITNDSTRTTKSTTIDNPWETPRRLEQKFRPIHSGPKLWNKRKRNYTIPDDASIQAFMDLGLARLARQHPREHQELKETSRAERIMSS